MFKYHEKLATKMAAHLRLTAETIDSSAWLAASMLSKNPREAQQGAWAYQEHLMRARTKTKFDEAFTDEPGNVEELAAFCALVPPSVLWGAGGAFQRLFRVLSFRFTFFLRWVPLAVRNADRPG